MHGPTRAAGLRPPIVERRYLVPFLLVTSLFFAWALAAALNDILIRQFQKALDLTRTQSSLIQLAFYVGYFCAALPAGLLIRRIGYKRTILAGLLCYAVGAFLFYPAAVIQRYSLFLGALYILAFGLAFLETAANPYVSVLGDSETAASRLNLAQSFYGVGAILGPIIGGLFIFSGVEYTPHELARMTPAAVAAFRAHEAASVQLPYVLIGTAVCLLAIVIARTRFPVIDTVETSTTPRPPLFAVLRHKQLSGAVIAQFFYVGAQVGVWSFFIDFAKTQAPQLDERVVAFMLSASLGLLMIGRFTGAFIQRLASPARLLLLYAAVNVALCLIASTTSGFVAVGALWATSFFMSIMFPTIFALGINGLGAETDSGSAFLIMSIIGGALIPPAMGLVADRVGGVQHMMLVPMICFAVCVVFALRVGSARREVLA